MESFRKQITDYCADIVNQIDIQTEKALKKFDNSKDKQIECEKIRSVFIQKIKEFEKSSLNNVSNDSKLAFEKCFCFFIPNFNLNVEDDTNENNENFEIDYGLCYFKSSNYIGNLFMLNVFLTKDIITYLNQIINSNYEDDLPNLESYEELIKSSILLNLINSPVLKKNKSEIIDLTDQQKNVIEELKLSDNGNDLQLHDFEYLEKIINLELLNKVSITCNTLEFIRIDILSFFKNLTYLIIEFTMPIEVSKDLFNGLDKLKKLKIQGLIGIQKEAFNGLTNLENLDLSENQISDLEADVFKNLEKLEYLDLSSNQLTIIHNDTFKYLEKLEYLNLSSNQLTIIRNDMFKYLNKLINLNISENELDVIEEKAFNGLENLRHLRICYYDYQMSYKELKIHQTSLELCKNLEILNLSHFQIANPDNLKCNKNLKYLNLHSSYMAEASFLNNFENLEVLILDENMLELKDLNSISLPNLKYLLLSCKNIAKFGAGFKNLKALDLDNVSFIESDSFENFEKLEYLKISPKKVPFYNENLIFNKLENLRFIKFNTITKINTINVDLNQVKKLFFANQKNIEPKCDHLNCVYRDDECKTGASYLNSLDVSSFIKEEIQYLF